LNGKGDVTGDVAVSVAGKTVSEEKGVQCALGPNAERGGVTAKCTTKSLELAKSVPTKVDWTVKNGSNETVTCTQTFLLP
jgi:hypothetical protein